MVYKLDSLDKMYKFLETQNLLRLSNKENVNRSITSKEIESVIKNLKSNQKSPGPDGFPGEFYQILRGYQSFSNFPQKLKRREHCGQHCPDTKARQKQYKKRYPS